MRWLVVYLRCSRGQKLASRYLEKEYWGLLLFREFQKNHHFDMKT